MSKLLKRNPRSEENSEHISQQKASIDSLIATHTTDVDAHHTPGGHGDYNVVDLYMIPNSTAYIAAEFLTLNATSEYFSVYFYIDPAVVDSSADLVFTFVYGVNDVAGDATVAYKKYVGSMKTDGNENFQFNISNGIAINLVGTNQAIYKFQLTVANADFEDADMVRVRLFMNEAGRDHRFLEAQVKHKKV